MSWFGRKSRKAVGVAEQVRILAECGVSLARGVEPAALTRVFTPAQFEADPFRLVLTTMGGEAQDGQPAGPSGLLSDDIWHFDTECIEDAGDYSRIAARLVALAKGELPLAGIGDYVNVEEGSAWLEFSLDGTRHRWDAAVQDDWVDTTILGRLARLLAQRSGSDRRFTYIDLGGQDCLIGCATPDQKARLQKLTGLKVDWLE